MRQRKRIIKQFKEQSPGNMKNIDVGAIDLASETEDISLFRIVPGSEFLDKNFVYGEKRIKGTKSEIASVGNIKVEEEGKAVDGWAYNKLGVAEPLYNFEALAQLPYINPTDYACVWLKSRCVAGMGWDAVIRDDIENIPEREAKKELEIAKRFIKRCHPKYSFSEILERFWWDVASIGNGYLEIIRDSENKPAAIAHKHGGRMRVLTNMNGYAYQLDDNSYVYFKNIGDLNTVMNRTSGKVELQATKEKINFDKATEILHMPIYSSSSVYYGYPEVSIVPHIYRTYLYMQSNLDFIMKRYIPDLIIFLLNSYLTKDDPTVKTLREALAGGSKAKNIAQLVTLASRGNKDVKVQVERLAQPADSEGKFAKAMEDDEHYIIQAHGVPSKLVAVITSGSGSKGEFENEFNFFKETYVRPMQERLAEKLNRFLIEEEGLNLKYIKLQPRQMRITDLAKMAPAFKNMTDSATLIPNEIREIVGLARKPGLDKVIINSPQGLATIDPVSGKVDLLVSPVPQMAQPKSSTEGGKSDAKSKTE